MRNDGSPWCASSAWAQSFWAVTFPRRGINFRRRTGIAAWLKKLGWSAPNVRDGARYDLVPRFRNPAPQWRCELQAVSRCARVGEFERRVSWQNSSSNAFTKLSFGACERVAAGDYFLQDNSIPRGQGAGRKLPGPKVTAIPTFVNNGAQALWLPFWIRLDGAEERGTTETTFDGLGWPAADTEQIKMSDQNTAQYAFFGHTLDTHAQGCGAFPQSLNPASLVVPSNSGRSQEIPFCFRSKAPRLRCGR